MSRSFKPRCYVFFEPGPAGSYRFNRGEFDSELSRPANVQLDASPDLLHCRCAKRLGTPAGTFQITLTYSREAIARQLGRNDLTWNLVLQEDNLVRILFTRGEKELGPNWPAKFRQGGGSALVTLGEAPAVTWMIGLIDQITESTRVGPTGSVQRTITVVGRDLGKLLAVHQLHWQRTTAWVLGRDEVEERLSGGVIIQGTPGEVTERLLDLLLTDAEFQNAAKYIVYRGTAAVDPVSEQPVISPKTKVQSEHGYLLENNIWDRGPFWNFLDRYNDKPFTELFTDTRPDGMFSVYLRPAPFDEEAWQSLVGGPVPDDEILSHQVGASDSDRLNLISLESPWLNAVQQDADFWGLYLMRWDRWSQLNGSTHHGLRKYVNRSIYNNLAGDGAGSGGIRRQVSHDLMHDDAELRKLERGEGELADFFARRVDRLYKWFSPNIDFYSGRFIVKGDPFWRIGYRFENQPEPSSSFSRFEGVRRWYYVEQVVQDYVFGSHYLTHLGVTRGQPLGIILDPPAPAQRGAT